jgi:porin
MSRTKAQHVRSRLNAATLSYLLFLASLCALMLHTAPATADEAPVGSDLGNGPLVGPRWGRPPLTGDWFGVRRTLAEKGLTFGIELVDIVQGIAEGGTDGDIENNGSIYLEAHFDSQKAGLWPGGFADLRVEKSYGKTINAKTATILGANMVGLFPDGDDETVVISKLTITQFLTEWAGLSIGRFDTADGDANHFAAGRGRTQFLNPRLTFSPMSGLTTPYVVNGIMGIGLTPNPLADHPGLLSLVFADPNVMPDSSGFDDDFFDDQYYAAQYTLPTRFFDLPGAQSLGFNYNSREQILLADLLAVVLPGQDPGHDSAWVLSYNFHQYLQVRDTEDPTANGYDANTPQLEGFGVFGRVGYSDADVNPAELYFALGLSGRGLGSMRRSDTYAIAAFTTEISSDIDLPVIKLEDDVWGIEMYYNFQVTPWLHITPDLQILEPILQSVDTSVVLGLRTKIDF